MAGNFKVKLLRLLEISFEVFFLCLKLCSEEELLLCICICLFTHFAVWKLSLLPPDLPRNCVTEMETFLKRYQKTAQN